MELEELKTKLEERENQTSLIRFENNDLKYVVENKLPKFEMDDGKYILNYNAEYNLCSLLGVHWEYHKKCPNELKEFNINYWINHLRHKLETWAVYTRDNKVEVFANTMYPHLSAEQIVDTVVNALGKSGQKVNNLQASEKGIEIEFLTEKKSEVNVGDVTSAGVVVRHSDREQFPTQMQGFLYRLQCTNGMEVSEKFGNVRMSSINEPEIVLMKVNDITHAIMGNMDGYIEKYENKMNNIVENTEASFQGLFRKYNISHDVREMILDAFQKEPGNTEWALIQAVSSAANSVDSNLRLRLRRIAGEMATSSEINHCPRCYTVLG